jgi:thymidylate synthase (FAD)
MWGWRKCQTQLSLKQSRKLVRVGIPPPTPYFSIMKGAFYLKVLEQEATMLTPSLYSPLIMVEYAGRTCYNSTDKMGLTETSSNEFVRKLIKNGHESPLEFLDITFHLVTSRDVMAELTRHRIASFSIQSQRYVAPVQDDGEKHVEFIKPEFYRQFEDRMTDTWIMACKASEQMYFLMLKAGAKKEDARKVLNNSVATEIVMKMNARELRHFFSLRTAKAAYPEMRRLAKMMLVEARKIPVVFDDFKVDEE